MRIFVQICFGIKYLHDNKIFHRDINISNILLKNDFEIKIADFGKSVFLKNIQKEEEQNDLSIIEKNLRKFEFDIKSLGFILYEMCNENKFIKSNKNSNLKKLIKKGI